jgi:hypothetical protein
MVTHPVFYSAISCRELASDRWAWLQTRGTAGFRPIDHPVDLVNWATVATAGATSWVHADTEGFATSTQPLTGSKYWVTFTRDPSVAPHSTRGDMGSASFAPPFAQFQDHNFNRWMVAEAILLGPTDLLYVLFFPALFIISAPHISLSPPGFSVRTSSTTLSPSSTALPLGTTSIPLQRCSRLSTNVSTPSHAVARSQIRYISINVS